MAKLPKYLVTYFKIQLSDVGGLWTIDYGLWTADGGMIMGYPFEGFFQQNYRVNIKK